jgi:2-dehydro-3-deoxy-D-arabinonate dehydratase
LLLFRTPSSWVVGEGEKYVEIGKGAEAGITTRDDLHEFLRAALITGKPVAAPTTLLAPIESQEVWAAGVTYYRSRTARMAESHDAGGGDFYDRVYSAERPEVFFKATAHRVVGDGAAVRIRRDSKWNVPEPELALLISASAKILGYSVGNDMSSRDIEGENPLYLPQAKVYDKCAALGPAILVTPEALPASTAIRVKIVRNGETMVDDGTSLKEMKRTPTELVSYLYREASFPHGAFLMTGTGVVPPDDFTLEPGDVVEITIDGIGTLRNTVERLA